MKNKVIGIIATLDTKGKEVAYIKGEILKKGKNVMIIDSGTSGIPEIEADITRDVIAKASGHSVACIAEMGRGQAIEVVQGGLKIVVKKLFKEGKIHALFTVGGADGSLLGSAAMQELPLGVPKMIVTPVAQGQEKFGPYIGKSDIVIMHSVIDILGINKISKKIYDIAIGAIVGMSEVKIGKTLKTQKTIAITMYGNTTPAVMYAKRMFEEKNYEVVVFHPNGTGGEVMEELIGKGVFDAVLDMTPHEITDYLFGGIHAGGPDRLTAAGKHSVPQLIIPGCLDFITKGPLGTIEQKYKNRKTYFFNPALCLVRTSKDEMFSIGKHIAEKLNKAKGPTGVLIPLHGFSMYAKKGGVMYDPDGDKTFIESLKAHLNQNIQIEEVSSHINDASFAEKAVESLINLIKINEIGGLKNIA